MVRVRIRVSVFGLVFDGYKSACTISEIYHELDKITGGLDYLGTS